MSSICNKLREQFEVLESIKTTLQEKYQSGLQTGDFKGFDRITEKFKEQHKTFTEQLKQPIETIVKRFIELRDNKDDIVSVRIDKDYKVIIDGHIRFSKQMESFSVPSVIKEITGDLIVSSAKIFNANSLQSVGRSLNASSSKTFNADSLQSVGWELNAPSAKTFNADSLQSVGWSLDAPLAETFNADSLQSVGYSLIASSAKTFKAPLLTHIGCDYKDISLTITSLEDVSELDLSSIQEIKGNVIIKQGANEIKEYFQTLKDRGVLKGEIVEQ